METLSDDVLQNEEAGAQRGIGDAGERSWKNLEGESSFQESAGQEIPGNERQFQDLSLLNGAGESKKRNAEEEIVPALVQRSGKYKGEEMQKETVMMELTGLVQKAVNESSWWERRGIDCAILIAAFLSLPAGFLLLGCSHTLLFSLGILVMGTAHAVITVKGTHLATHGSLSESQAWGRFWAVFFIELCGSFTARAGVQAHIKMHHAHTNIIGLGDSSTWKLPFLPRYVYMFVAPLAVPVITPVVALGLLKDLSMGIALRALCMITLGLYSQYWLLLHLSGFQSPVSALLCMLLCRAAFSLPYIHVNIFQHIGLPMFSPSRRPSRIHQMTHGVLNLPRNPLLDWTFGHSLISCHVEHHLFPFLSDHMCLKNELKQTQIELDRKVKAAETAISKLQTNATSIENSVQEVKVSIDQQFSELLEAVEKAKKKVMEVLESEERSAVKQAEGIRAHLEQKCAELKKTHTQIQKMTKNKNDVPFLQEFSEWKKGASDDTLPSVYIGLKDRLTSFSRVVSEASQAIRDELLSTFKNQLKELCKDEKCGIKTTVAVIRSPKHHFSAPEPKTRSDFLQYTSPLSFDPETTHRYLRLTEDNHKVTNTAPWQHQYPDVPERFEHWRQVLCAESFYLGRHYFEVDISGDGTHVGLTYKSIDHKGKESNGCITSNDFSWCLHWSSRDFSAWHGDLETPVKATGKFTRIGIYVDYARGSLAFYGIADSMTLIHKYQAEFNEPLYPACWLSKKENMVLLVSPGEALPQRSPSPPPTQPSAAGVQTAQ